MEKTQKSNLVKTISVAIFGRAGTRTPGQLGSKTALYGFLYLACIPGFALLYYLMSDHFYQSTYRFEPALHRIEENTKWYLNKLADTQFYKAGIALENVGGFQDPNCLHTCKVMLESVQGTPEGLVFETRCIVKDNSDPAQIHKAVIVDNVLSWTLTKTPRKPWRYEEPSIGVTIEKCQPELAKLIFKITGPNFHSHYESAFNFGRQYVYQAEFADFRGMLYCQESWKDMSSDVMFIGGTTQTCPEYIFSCLTQYHSATQGRPQGGWIRFFYLSAVTITTLGYGDIVPVTDAARLAVSTESIAGIVLIGLFLNSLTSHWKRNKI